MSPAPGKHPHERRAQSHRRDDPAPLVSDLGIGATPGGAVLLAPDADDPVGFIQTHLVQRSGFFARAGGILLGGVMLLDVLFRGQISLCVSFFEEIYSRNLSHLMATPLRLSVFAMSLMAASLLRTLIGWVPATLFAIWFFGFSIYTLGLALGLFFLSLIAFGWSIGLVVAGLVLRFGLGAEGMAWSLIFALAPLSGEHYPVSVLSAWLQWASHILPASYIFEGMRAILTEPTFRPELLVAAFALNLLWLAGGPFAFFAFTRAARNRGMLLQVGE